MNVFIVLAEHNEYIPFSEEPIRTTEIQGAFATLQRAEEAIRQMEEAQKQDIKAAPGFERWAKERAKTFTVYETAVQE